MGAITAATDPNFANDGGGFLLNGGDDRVETVTFAPVDRGSQSTAITVTTDPDIGSKTFTYSGEGVAPVLDTGVIGEGAAVRVGTSGTVTVEIENSGNGNENEAGLDGDLEGTVGAASGAFSGAGSTLELDDGSTASISYDFAPTNRGVAATDITLDFANGNPDGSNTEYDDTLTVSGTGVGPVFSANPAPIDFGSGLLSGTPLSLDVEITNSTSDSGADSLVGLSLLDATLSGPGDLVSLFELVLPSDTVLSPGETQALILNLVPNSGLFPAGTTLDLSGLTLTLDTDVGAAFGGDGADYDLALSGALTVSMVPVPSGLGLLFLGVGALHWRRSSTAGARFSRPRPGLHPRFI